MATETPPVATTRLGIGWPRVHPVAWRWDKVGFGGPAGWDQRPFYGLGLEPGWREAAGRGWKGKGGWRGVQTVILPPQVGQGYPHDPPKVKCETMVYHPNIDLEGNVCLNILRWDTGVVEVVVAVPSGAESHFGPTYPSGWNGV